MSLLDMGTASGFHTFFASVAAGRNFLMAGAPIHNVHQIDRHGVVSIKASPVQLLELVTALDEMGFNLPSLRVIQVAGSALPPHLADRVRRRTGAEIHCLYGSSEAGTVAARHFDTANSQCVGPLTPESQLQIVDDHDRPVAAGREGIVRYRRPLQATSYMKDAKSSAASFRNGWFYPGDLGRVDQSGNLYIGGRVDSVVNAGGVKVDLDIVTAITCALNGVRDAAAFPLATEIGLTSIAIAVVLETGATLDVVVDLMRQRLGSNAPTTILQMESIPRNAMGKLMRPVVESLIAKDQ